MAGSAKRRFFQRGPRGSGVLPLTLTLEGAMMMSLDPNVGVSLPTTWVLFLLSDYIVAATRNERVWTTDTTAVPSVAAQEGVSQ